MYVKPPRPASPVEDQRLRFVPCLLVDSSPPSFAAHVALCDTSADPSSLQRSLATPVAACASGCYRARAPRHGGGRLCICHTVCALMSEPSFLPSLCQLRRLVIRPRVRCRGDKVTVTRSPSRIRTKFRLGPPDTCATICSFESSSDEKQRTRQRVDDTTLCSSRCSVLIGHLSRPSARPRVGLSTRANRATQDDGPLLGYGHRVLKMRRQAAIARHGGPTVVEHTHPWGTRAHHRLDGQDHPFEQPGSASRLPVVRDLRAPREAASQYRARRTPAQPRNRWPRRAAEQQRRDQTPGHQPESVRWLDPRPPGSPGAASRPARRYRRCRPSGQSLRRIRRAPPPCPTKRCHPRPAGESTESRARSRR